MPEVSIITPTHSLRWLDRAWTSVKAQTFSDWEWVILANGDAKPSGIREIVGGDGRVVLRQAEPMFWGNIGALKRRTCDHATGPFIVELDHDDELSHDALHVVIEEFRKTDAAFVFSRYAGMNGSEPVRWSADSGWVYETIEFHGDRPESVESARLAEIYPQNISRIWYAPNHIRAWRRTAYDAVGGYDPTMRACDDQELMCRLYIESMARFSGIDKCLYKYHVHGRNSWLQQEIGGEIRATTLKVHDRYIEQMAFVYWHGKARCIDLAIVREQSLPEWERWGDGYELISRLSKAWPCGNDEAGVIRIGEALQQLSRPGLVFEEAYRCIKHGGLLLIDVPSADGTGAFCGGRIASFWNQCTIWMLSGNLSAEMRGRFQIVRMVNYYPSEWHKKAGFVMCRAHLAVQKDGPRLHGPHHTLSGPPMLRRHRGEIYE